MEADGRTELLKIEPAPRSAAAARTSEELEALVQRDGLSLMDFNEPMMEMLGRQPQFQIPPHVDVVALRAELLAAVEKDSAANSVRDGRRRPLAQLIDAATHEPFARALAHAARTQRLSERQLSSVRYPPCLFDGAGVGSACVGAEAVWGGAAGGDCRR